MERAAYRRLCSRWHGCTRPPFNRTSPCAGFDRSALGRALQFAQQKIVETLPGMFWGNLQVAYPAGGHGSRHRLKRTSRTVIVRGRLSPIGPKGRRNRIHTRYRFSSARQQHRRAGFVKRVYPPLTRPILSGFDRAPSRLVTNFAAHLDLPDALYAIVGPFCHSSYASATTASPPVMVERRESFSMKRMLINATQQEELRVAPRGRPETLRPRYRNSRAGTEEIQRLQRPRHPRRTGIGSGIRRLRRRPARVSCPSRKSPAITSTP